MLRCRCGGNQEAREADWAVVERGCESAEKWTVRVEQRTETAAPEGGNDCTSFSFAVKGGECDERADEDGDVGEGDRERLEINHGGRKLRVGRALG